MTLKMYEQYSYPELEVGDQDWRWCHRYAADVVNGKIKACKNVIAACQRHLDDLEREDVYFDEKKAASIVKWFKFIPLTDADSFKPTVLLPWQIFLVCSLIAWLREEVDYDDLGNITARLGIFKYRRFDRAFVLIGRKNGKTTLVAGVMLYIMYVSPFRRPRAYSLATKMEQAREVWSTAADMIRLSPRLSTIFQSRRHDILLPTQNGEFKPLPNDSKTLDGKNPLVASLDEAHAVKDFNLYGVIGSAFGSQKEGMLITITTAGTILDGICTTLWKNGKRCLDENDPAFRSQDNYFYLMYQLDEGDDWEDESNWIKANAGLGYQPTMRYLRNQCREAKLSIEEKANFLTKHCNLFVSGSAKWLDTDEVLACKDESLYLDVEKYQHRECYLAIDRARVHDLTSFCLIFPNPDGGADLFFKNLLPKPTAMQVSDYLKNVYMKAAEEGDLILLPTTTVRDEAIKEHIRWFYFNFPKLQMVGYDPWHMREIAEDMIEENVPMVEVSQGTGNMSEPAKKLEGLVKETLLRYNSRLFEFACANAIIKVTDKNNVLVTRDNPATEKIDPLISSIIGLSCATLVKVDRNIYETRGMILL